MEAKQQHDVVIVGGGVAGLTAAWELRDRDVLLLEASSRLGGRIRSERRGDYWLNFGAHVFGASKSASGRLIEAIGIEAQSVPGRLAAVSLNGKIVASGPVEAYPLRLPMPLRSRLALVRAGIRLRLAVRRYAGIAASREGESPAALQQRMLEFLDDRSFKEFLGDLPQDVDALFRSTVTRSSGEPEDLSAGYGVGYFHLVWNRGEGLSRNILGGSGELIETLAAQLGDRVEVRTRASVTAIAPENGGVRVSYRAGEQAHAINARAAIVATPAYTTREIVRDLPDETAAALEAIPYGPYVVGAFLTGEQSSMPWDDIYALATPNRSFSMLFNTASLLRASRTPRLPGGSLMVYAAAGAARRLADLDDTAVAQLFVSDLEAVYPQTKGIIEEVAIERWNRGLPYPRPGRSGLQPALTRSISPIFLAGDYLGTWYTETAVRTAIEAASQAREQLHETPVGELAF